MEQKQIQLTNNITELGNQKIVAENYLNLLFPFISNLGNLQSFLKKINTLVENPKVILIYLLYNFSKDDENGDIIDNSNKKDDNNYS